MATATDQPEATPRQRPMLAARTRAVRILVVLRYLWRRFARAVGNAMPKGLFARSILIIITPVVLLQALVAFVFMERNWQAVTARLSQSLVGDIAAIVDVVEDFPSADTAERIARIGRERFGLSVALLPPEPLPPVSSKPFFSALDRVLAEEISTQIGKPFWIDTVGRSNVVEVRIQLSDGVLRVFAPRIQTYASNSLVFLSWMVATSLILLAIAIIFLRNQIKPILRLTAAVDDFGKGRAVADFEPRGAREVRQATIAFRDMRERVERQIDQRTAMLAGVSHDLRTVLTRLRLQLAFIADGPDAEAMKADIDAMDRMLEGYLAFARGIAAEDTVRTDIRTLLNEIAGESRLAGHETYVNFAGEPDVNVRPQAFKRCLVNLVMNAGRHASAIAIEGRHADDWLTITIDDDGPGIPFEEQEAVFKPFYRLDAARNVDESGTGLGLPIARDIARSHGGDITLSDSPLGGLRAMVRIPA